MFNWSDGVERSRLRDLKNGSPRFGNKESTVRFGKSHVQRSEGRIELRSVQGERGR